MDKARSAELLMNLYDLRREKVMREARNWIQTFFPESADELAKTMMDPEVGGYLRMVISYWDMASSFVNHGAIDREMFYDVNGEFVVVYCKIRPFISEIREMFDSPQWMAHLEKAVNDMPGSAERIERVEGWMKDFRSKMEENASGQAG